MIEGSDVSFTCVLNYDDVAVTWYKHGAQLRKSRSVMIDARGAFHKLTLTGAKVEDVGSISIVAENLQVVFIIAKVMYKNPVL